MGALHHAFTGTGAIALAAAATLPGSLVALVIGAPRESVRAGHASGTLRVGATLGRDGDRWHRARVERSSRLLMSGILHVALPAVR